VPLAELEGVIQALKNTLGPITLAVDSAITIKTFNRGRNYVPPVNVQYWRRFWEQAGDRQITMVKVKSHTRPAPEREDGPPIDLWLANGTADAAADEGARRAQLPGHVITEVCRIDELTAKVQEHLVAVALHVASRAPELYGLQSCSSS